MSLDGGYTGSLDHAIANLHVGRNQGRQQGLDEGYQQGLQDGRLAGWNEATIKANAQMREQLAYTRQHVEEKERIRQELRQQRILRNDLEAKVARLEQENAQLRNENVQLRSPDSGLRGVVKALKEANLRLQEKAAELDAKYHDKARQLNDQLWQYNRSLVFMNSVRRVLEELTCEDNQQAHHIRALFVEKYAQQVTKAITTGCIKAPPHEDDEFAQLLPQTQQFIANMLLAAENKQVIDCAPQDADDDDWVP